LSRRKDKPKSLGVNLVRSQQLYRAAQVQLFCNAAGIILLLLLASWDWHTQQEKEKK